MREHNEIKNKEELLKQISKEKYGDEWFIEKAIITYQNQQNKTYTFFRDDKKEDLLNKYNWCQRPDSTNMSLHRFIRNGEIEGYMSESLAEHHGLVQVDLNEFIHKFVKPLVKANIYLSEDAERMVKRNSSGYDKMINMAKKKAKEMGIYDNPDLLEKGKEE